MNDIYQGKKRRIASKQRNMEIEKRQQNAANLIEEQLWINFFDIPGEAH